jgi:arylsulfatase A-like enzyme
MAEVKKNKDEGKKMSTLPCTRRGFLRTIGLGAASLALPDFTLGIEDARRKPNVVLIFTDDQGTIDVNCFGSSDLSTPHLDTLAKRGTRLTQFYVTAPVCSPSRASLLTGRYPERAELTTNAGGNQGMPGHQVTIAEMLKAAGYRTAIFGKWHLGEQPEMSPLAQGFDEFLGHKVGCIDNYSHFYYWAGPNRHDMWRNDAEIWEEGNYFPDMVVREAQRFLEENKDRLFFFYLPFNMPHYPLQAQAKYRAMYAGREEPRAMYAAFVSTLDEKIGKVIETIDQLGLREKTLIIFLSDHGHSVEVRTFGGGGNAGPFRGHKFTVWEGGIRVPCIVSWPGRIPEGGVRDQIAISTDWMPTIAHYCGVRLPEARIDGKNIASVLASASAPSPHDVLHWRHGNQWAVREGDWKLVFNGPASEYKGGQIPAEEIFLSNVERNLSETKNLAKAYPHIVERLTRLHEGWAKEATQQ